MMLLPPPGLIHTPFPIVRHLAGAPQTQGGGSIIVAYPSGIPSATNHLLALLIANKYPPSVPDAPAGWTFQDQETGGTGAAADDSGNVTATAYTKEAAGESGTLTVTVPSSNSTIGRFVWFRSFKPAGGTWDIATAKGQCSVAGLTWSCTFDGDPGVQLHDYLVVFSALNGNAGGSTRPSSASLAVPGCAISSGIPIGNATGTWGDDCGHTVQGFMCRGGVSSGVASYSTVYAGSTATSPAGASILMRLRYTPP